MDDFAPPASDDYSTDLDGPARTAAVLAVLGLCMHSMMCCMSVMGTIGGTMLCGVALFMAHGLLQQDPVGEAKAYANVAYGAGVFGVAWGLFIAFGIFCYIMLYVVLIAVLVVVG